MTCPSVNVLFWRVTRSKFATLRCPMITRPLEFPNGIRLARLEEIPGPEPDRSAAWERIMRSHIVPGFTVADSSSDVRFRYYAEINVDASQIWEVFRDLCAGLLTDPAALLAGDDEDIEPHKVAQTDVPALLRALAPYHYQLAHDGFLQFALVSDHADQIAEVLVTPTKHFKVWLNDIALFRAIMEHHEIRERAKMEFIDEYPRVTTRLPEGNAVVADPEILWRDIADLVTGAPLMQ